MCTVISLIYFVNFISLNYSLQECGAISLLYNQSFIQKVDIYIYIYIYVCVCVCVCSLLTVKLFYVLFVCFILCIACV